MGEPAVADERAGKRPWLAAVLAVIVPGLGHVYIKMWGRALLWFALYFATTRLLVPSDAYPASISIEALGSAGGAVPLHVAVLIVSIAALNVCDAYLMTVRRNGRFGRSGADGDGDGQSRCPHCKKDLDADLDFCHWCTTRLEVSPGDEA